MTYFLLNSEIRLIMKIPVQLRLTQVPHTGRRDQTRLTSIKRIPKLISLGQKANSKSKYLVVQLVGRATLSFP